MKLALGTVQFGLPYGIANQTGLVSREEAKVILALARSSGIDTLDTAIAYGESETCLGEIGAKGFKVITKLPAIPEQVADVGRWVYEQMQAALQRLGVQTVYGLLLHRSQQLVGPNGKALEKALEQLKAEGMVQKIGVSIYSPSELVSVTQACAIDLVQAPFNLIDQRLLSTGWLRKLHLAGIEIHTRSAFLQGLLLMPKTTISHKFKPWDELWDRWQAWLKNHPVSAVEACLAFPLSFAEIERVVVGVDSATQFKELILAANAPQISFPRDLACDDERLINPANWHQLENT